MSDIPAHYRERLDIQEQIERIDRLREEARKFATEQHKLAAEARKFGRDPWFLLIGAIIAAVATRLPEILHAVGVQ